MENNNRIQFTQGVVFGIKTKLTLLESEWCYHCTTPLLQLIFFKNVYMYAIMRPSYLGGRRVGLPVVSLVEEKAVFPLVFTFVLVLFFVAVAVLTCLLATSLVGINIVIT